jgi:hypothetical protein
MEKIEFTRINRDVNGNPRYVCHFLSIPVTDQEMEANKSSGYKIEKRYRIAVKKANKIGGRKFHNKQFGGGIVFQSYNLDQLTHKILAL